MQNKCLYGFIVLLLLTPLIFAVNIEYIFKINEDANIKISCFDTDNTLCTDSTTCYITIHDPDGLNIVKNGTMTQSDSYYNYSVGGSLLTKKGEYSTTVNCEGDYNGFTQFLFSISSSGERPGGSGVAGVGILVLLIVINIGAFSIARVHLSKNVILNHILKGGCVLTGLYLLSLNMTIAVTLADNFTLGINQELFRFLWLINWIIYITMFIVIFRYLLETLRLWTEKKTLRRMGLDKLE